MFTTIGLDTAQTGIYKPATNGIMDPRLREDDGPFVIPVQTGIYKPVTNGIMNTHLRRYDGRLVFGFTAPETTCILCL